MQRTFIVYADPGHAWGKVHTGTLSQLGLTTEDFSSCSYRFGDYIYLEEDGDLSYFTKVYKEKTGLAPLWTEKNCDGRSTIRRYNANQAGEAYRNRTARAAA